MQERMKTCIINFRFIVDESRIEEKSTPALLHLIENEKTNVIVEQYMLYMETSFSLSILPLAC